MRSYTQGEVTTIMRRRLERQGITQAALAKQFAVSPTFICLVLNGQRRPTGPLLKWLGFEPVVTYSYLRRRSHNGGATRGP